MWSMGWRWIRGRRLTSWEECMDKVVQKPEKVSTGDEGYQFLSGVGGRHLGKNEWIKVSLKPEKVPNRV